MTSVDAMHEINRVIAAGPFVAHWDSLHAYHVPSWYEDAKFGIFIPRSATIPFTHVCSGRWDGFGPRVAPDTALPRVKPL